MYELERMKAVCDASDITLEVRDQCVDKMKKKKELKDRSTTPQINDACVQERIIISSSNNAGFSLLGGGKSRPTSRKFPPSPLVGLPHQKVIRPN